MRCYMTMESLESLLKEIKNATHFNPQLIAAEVMIAERFIWFRVAILKMTQQQLADALNKKHAQTISKYEIGKLKPSVKLCRQLVKLAKEAKFNIDVSWFRPDLFV